MIRRIVKWAVILMAAVWLFERCKATYEFYEYLEEHTYAWTISTGDIIPGVNLHFVHYTKHWDDLNGDLQDIVVAHEEEHVLRGTFTDDVAAMELPAYDIGLMHTRALIERYRAEMAYAQEVGDWTTLLVTQGRLVEAQLFYQEQLIVRSYYERVRSGDWMSYSPIRATWREERP